MIKILYRVLSEYILLIKQCEWWLVLKQIILPDIASQHTYLASAAKVTDFFPYFRKNFTYV